jgi:hypothetical protein
MAAFFIHRSQLALRKRRSSRPPCISGPPIVQFLSIHFAVRDSGRTRARTIKENRCGSICLG